MVPDEGYNLVNKLILLFGIFGALRCGELTNLKFSDVKMKTNENGKLMLEVSLDTHKTDKEEEGFHFPIPSMALNCPVKMYMKYKKLVGKNTSATGRLWRTYNVGHKKFTLRPMGRHVIGGIPKKVAKILNLEKPERYTGHSFRRTSTTLVAESGVSLVNLKRFGRWKSTTTALGYISNSNLLKNQTAKKLKYNLSRQKTTKKRRNVVFKHCIFNVSGIKNLCFTEFLRKKKKKKN